MRQAIQFSQLGCLPRGILLIALGAWMFWINSPATAQERWQVKADWQSVATGRTEARYYGAAIAQDGTVIVFTTGDIRLYTGKEFALTQTLPITASLVFFSPDQSMIAARPQSSSGAGAVSIYRASDGALLHQLDNPREEPIWDIVWSSNNHILAIRSIDFKTATYRYWDSSTGKQVVPPFPQPQAIIHMTYRMDRQIVYLSTPDTLIAVDIRSGREIYRRPLPTSKLILTLDGLILLAYERGHVRAFNTSDGTPLWELGIDDSDPNRTLRFPTVSAVAFSPDNQYLAIGESRTPGFFFGWVGNGQIALVRVADGTIVRQYQGQEGRIGSLGFTADGQFFLSSNSEEIARWNVETRQPWLIWLPIIGIVLLLLQGVWQWFQNRRTSP